MIGLDGGYLFLVIGGFVGWLVGLRMGEQLGKRAMDRHAEFIAEISQKPWETRELWQARLQDVRARIESGAEE